MSSRVVSVCCSMVLALQAVAQQPQVSPPSSDRWYERAAGPYRPSTVAPVSFANSTRLDNLIRGGILSLSLEEAIALALENNLDIELQRFSPAIADTDVQRAEGGTSVLRGVPLAVNLPPQGVGGPASPLLNIPASGVTPTTTVPTTIPELASIIESQTSALITGTTNPYSTGPVVPLFDPSLVGNLNWQHQTTPQTNPSIAGADALIGRNVTGTLGLQKGLSYGTQIGANFNSNSQNTNSGRTLYNPNTASNLGLTLTQPLLRGFGSGVNRRFIRIAKNNLKVSDLVFQQQVTETVAGVIRLYYDLVTLTGDVAVKRQTLTLAERLYSDNKDKVDLGTLAPIELIRAQAQVAAARQDLANSEGFQRQQELLVKTVLSKRGTADPALRDARIETTTPINIPPRDDLRPVQDLIQDAVQQRPEIEEARLQIVNSNISLQGSRNQLLPQLDLVAAAQNSGLGGEINPLAPTSTTGQSLGPATGGEFSGGFGTALGQIFRRNYPSYGVGIQLNLPLRNRIAQGDYARDEITLRQSQIRMQQLENQVRLEVEAAIIALSRARASYEAAAETRGLQEKSLDIELEKYANGLSTNFLVMQYQSYVAQARSTEVAAKGVYIKARTALERATGTTLANHDIVLKDVLAGRINTPPTPITK